MKNDIIKDIKSGYGEGNPNDSFINDILYNIIDEEKYEVKGLPLPFCQDGKGKVWKNNLKKDEYVHLYPYLILRGWLSEFKENEVLNSWADSYKEEFCSTLISEMYAFKNDLKCHHSLSSDIIDIGLIIDSFLWTEKKEPPYFFSYAHAKGLQTEELYDKYITIFVHSLETYDKENLNQSISDLLNFSSAIDLTARKKECFCSIVFSLFEKRHKTTHLSSMLKYIPIDKCDVATFKRIIIYYCLNIENYKNLVGSEVNVCSPNNVVEFWSEELKNGHLETLLFYLVISQWLTECPNSEELKKWHSVFIDGEERQELENDIRFFIELLENNIQTIPEEIIKKVGCQIDKYLWEEYDEPPFLPSKIQLAETELNSYHRVLLGSIENNINLFINKTKDCLLFCLTIDSAMNNDTALKNVLKLISKNNTNNLTSLLISFPYINDDLGLTLLDFCERNRSLYGLSKVTISKYKNKLYLDSWMFEINKKLEVDGCPYNVELCEQTSSHKKITDFLNHRHPILWDECNKKSKEIVNKIRGEKLADKRSPVEERVKDMTKELTNREDRLVSGCIKPLIKEALREGVQNFIIETESLAKNKGKKIPLLEDVSNTIYDYLIRKYLNFDVSEFPGDTGVLSGFYGDKVARIWIRRYMIGDDEVSWESNLSNEKIAGAKIAFDNYIWNNIYDHVIGWCELNYGKIKSEEMDSFSDDSYDNDQDDYGIYRGGAFM